MWRAKHEHRGQVDAQDAGLVSPNPRGSVVFDWFSPAYRIFGRWAKAETTGLSHGEPPDIRPAGADPLVTG